MAKKAKRGGGSMLDYGMAAFAATAAGFVVYAMPGAQFDRAVELSGLPMLVPAANPPLGSTARLAAIAAAVLGTWTLVWLILRALSTKPPQAKRRQEPVEIDIPLPRIRRADAHPDAPARAPIFAGLELGKPLDDRMAEEEAFDEPEQSEFAEEETAFEPSFETASEPAFEPSFERAFESAFEPAEEPIEEPIEEPSAAAESEYEDEEHDAPAPAIVPAAELEQASISHLMQRLELGLLRRERPSWSDGDGEQSAANDQPLPAPPQLDDRLRSAIDDLQRLASRGG